MSTALSGWVLRCAGWGGGFPGRRVKPWPGIKPSVCRLHFSELPAAAAEEYPSPFPPLADVGRARVARGGMRLRALIHGRVCGVSC